ncbi:MAG: class I SAM-dependent methyltransferase [Rhodospirillales bacterium]|jgi:ubiquinone/menaquinone biosynthesis C-methylase UbiE
MSQKMKNRRGFLLGTSAAAAVALPSLKAIAGTADWDVEWRGTIGAFERLPYLDEENGQDFYRGFRYWINRDVISAARRRALEILDENGIAPDENIPMEQVMALMENDHIMGMSVLTWENTQQAMWGRVQDVYHADADLYLNELEGASKLGPGTLELRPNLEIPQYASYEIHLQPGGYVGDPFAGYIYVHGENIVFRNGNYQDDLQVSLARRVPAPKDGRINRVLEQGCSSGQFTLALKKKWPEAEVWGTDIAAPMIRYAHMRSVELGMETHYLQELNEDSQFPDDHFDVVTNNLLFHEVPGKIARGIIEEAFRTLRPGGVFYPIDLFTGNPPNETAFGKFWAWRDYRWNEEVWRMEYTALDMAAEMKRAGFVVELGPAARRGTKGNIMGTKPA